jgi:hypothetical protein
MKEPKLSLYVQLNNCIYAVCQQYYSDTLFRNVY